MISNDDITSKSSCKCEGKKKGMRLYEYPRRQPRSRKDVFIT